MVRDADEIRRWPLYDPRHSEHLAPAPDWNAEPVRVLCINAEWVSHIMGVLSRLARSDAWAGDADDKERALDQVDEIIAAFAKGMDCIPSAPGDSGGDSEDLPDIPSGYMHGGIVIIEGESMGTVVTRIAQDINTGRLIQFFGECCPQWVPIVDASIYGLGNPPNIPPTYPGDDDPVIPDVPDDPTIDVSCARSYYIALKFFEFAQTAFEQYNPIALWPSEAYISNMREAFPQYDLSRWSLFKLYQTAQTLTAADLALWDEVISPVMQQRMVCLANEVLSGSSYDLTDSEYDELKGIVGTLAVGIASIHLKTAWDALNRSNIRMLSSMAAHITYTDCACPDGEVNIPGPITASGYFLSKNIIDETGVIHTVKIDSGSGAMGLLAFVDKSAIATQPVYGIWHRFLPWTADNIVKPVPFGTDEASDLGSPVPDVSAQAIATSANYSDQGIQFGVPFMWTEPDFSEVAEQLAASMGFSVYARRTADHIWPGSGIPMQEDTIGIGWTTNDYSLKSDGWHEIRFIYKHGD